MTALKISIQSGGVVASGVQGGTDDDVDISPAEAALATLRGYVDQERRSGVKSELPFSITVEAAEGQDQRGGA